MQRHQINSNFSILIKFLCLAALLFLINSSNLFANEAKEKVDAVKEK